ncbi:hypothetical protein Y032_0093g2624 [Ancylostoma ceylanicum]|uniref:Uncharacterized protein n=1 Tax=Ancylostoma ceylanicum TaxID=53326 RepID=A0A016TLH0_9BILA|nr:hypothetical protein Y032_0093g2624 [Ancylostoma ceylanicum]
MDSVAAASFENHIWKFCTLEATSLVKRVCNFTPSFRKKWQQSSRARSSEQANDVCLGAVLLDECVADHSNLIRADLRDNPGIAHKPSRTDSCVLTNLGWYSRKGYQSKQRWQAWTCRTACYSFCHGN